MLKTEKNKNITHVKISNDEIQDIRLLYGNSKTLDKWYKETNADVIVNGSLFSGKKPIESFIYNGNVVSTSTWCNEGFGINFDKTVQFGKSNPYWLDFTSAFPMLLKNGEKYINFEVGKDLQGFQPRTIFSKTIDGIMITTIDGRTKGNDGATLEAASGIVKSAGAIHSANLDGGGSTRLLINGNVANTPCENRAVPVVLAVWLKKGEKKMKICIDAGHNTYGGDTGAEGFGIYEQDITFFIASKVANILRDKGIEVIETRKEKDKTLGNGDENSSLKARVNIANVSKADYFISIHCNSFTDSSANGTETYVVAFGGEAEKLAKCVQNEIITYIGDLFDRGVKTANFQVLRDTLMPAILIETAFISNEKDNNILQTKQDDFALAIANGILSYLGESKVTQQKNEYSYDNTVNNMVLDGVILKDDNLWQNIANWERMLNGFTPLNKDYVRTIFDRYHNR